MASSPSPSPTDALSAALERAIAACRVPGAVLAASRSGRTPVVVAAGVDALGRRLAADTVFPIASITKLATALAVLRLVDAGRLDLDAPLGRYLPQAASARPGVTLRRLLSHTAGLPSGSAERTAVRCELGLTWPAIVDGCLRVPLEAPPGTRVRYSPIGSCLAAAAVERVVGRDFALGLDELVLARLGIEAWLGGEPPRPPAVVADVKHFPGTPVEQFNTPFFRSLRLPSSGLLATAPATLALVRAFLDEPPGLLHPGTRRDAIANQAGDLGGGMGDADWPRCPWGLGPEIRGDKRPHWAPDRAGPDAFGHTGATGSLAYADPASGVAWAVLSTRTTTNRWSFSEHGLPAIGAAVIEALA